MPIKQLGMKYHCIGLVGARLATASGIITITRTLQKTTENI